MTSDGVTAGLPRAATAEGQAGLDAIASGPAVALIASDYDGTLAPIVADPAAAHVHRRHHGAIEHDRGDAGRQRLVIGVSDADARYIGEQVFQAADPSGPDPVGPRAAVTGIYPS